LSSRAAYAGAGVDIAAGERTVELLRRQLTSGDLLGGLGGFGAALPVPAGYRSPIVVSATDGVGTKTDIARRLGRYATIGYDLVAMWHRHGARRRA